MAAAPLVLAALLAAAPLAAQQEPSLAAATTPRVVDRVVAVVGDSVITETELEEAVNQELAQGQPPTDTAAVEKDVLKQKVDELVLLQAAQRDSTVVLPEQVQQAVDRDLAQRQQAFGSEAALLDALRRQGISMAEFRSMLTTQWTRSLMIQAYLQKMQQAHNPPPVTDEEIRAYYDKRKDLLGQKPATVSFRQVVVDPQPSDSARTAAYREAAKILAELRGGADFATLAKRYSDDPGTKDQGGDLGWFRRGQMVQAFEDAAFSLPPGAISNIVETPYGLHIIKVEKVRGPERQARHILIQPERTPEDLQRARELAQRLAQEVRNGASIDSLAKKYNDPSEQDRVGPYPVDKLPAPYDTALATVQTGQVVGPVELSADGQGPAKFAIVQITDVSPAGQYTLDDLRAQIRQQLEQQKMVDEIISDLRKKTYIDIRAS